MGILWNPGPFLLDFRSCNQGIEVERWGRNVSFHLFSEKSIFSSFDLFDIIGSYYLGSEYISIKRALKEFKSWSLILKPLCLKYVFVVGLSAILKALGRLNIPVAK